ncbi:MAG: GAF domain-containing protein [Planctomycetes bacterium]|nr:GAF domain-containing protein [Planctomycetota bacterium]
MINDSPSPAPAPSPSPPHPTDGALDVPGLLLLNDILEKMNQGNTLDEVFEATYARLRALLPYNRVAIALASPGGDRVTLVACRSDGPTQLSLGYSGRIAGSSLEDVLRRGRPRILNDLEDYLAQKPQSESTRLMVREGMRSSLTLPLLVKGRPVGIIFFSSRDRNAYGAAHELLLRQVAGHIAILVEKARLTAERERAQEELRRANLELEARIRERTVLLEDLARKNEHLRTTQEALVSSARLAAVGEMAASIAHEIKNPLAGISGAIQVMRDGLDPGHPHREIMKEVLAQVHRLDQTVRDLLAFSRPSRPSKVPLDLAAVVARIRPILEGDPALSGLVVEAAALDALGPVDADPHLVEDVLFNLLTNAAHAMPGGGAVTISGTALPHAVEIHVLDRGCGLSADVRGRLFRPFFTTKVRGTGLGLAICQKIMEAHGGAIRAENAPEGGTVVTLTFPRSRIEP